MQILRQLQVYWVNMFPLLISTFRLRSMLIFLYLKQ